MTISCLSEESKVVGHLFAPEKAAQLRAVT
jgi:hypothetical protein